MAPNEPLPGRSHAFFGNVYLVFTDVTALIGGDVKFILQCWSNSKTADAGMDNLA